MTELSNTANTAPIPELTEFSAGQQVLRDPQVRSYTKGSVLILGEVIGGEGRVLMPLAGEVAFGEAVSDTPASDTVQALHI